ncbi:hypothetical protein NQ315_006956 [Exocentrus adspersus]|uniref:Uncharacterized protein n=1 Tax=Exocentrus adspersus TaxID=1586481 RepID=A0AAV8WDA6_9CUCU|nr:hypothetical protein NQ315_006956 [Exocentrus adspersus]
MKQLLFLIAVSSLVRGVPTQSTTEPSTIPPIAATETPPTYDYIVQIGFNLDEENVPEYLVNLVYTEASSKTITTDDIFSLYGLKTIDRTTTLNFLEKLGFSTEKVFSLDGFDKFLTELRVDFKEFYNRVIIERLNITGNPLRDVLVALNIDINNFSMGMAYGEPNPYDEFRKGNYTNEAVLSALGKADRTLDELFVACRDEFVGKALTFTPERIVEILVRYDFGKDAGLSLWNALGLTMEDVYAVPRFKQLLNELNRELNKVPCLGVLTGTTNISINRKVYETWSNDENVVQPYAESVTRKFILQVLEKEGTEWDNIFLFRAKAVEPYDGDIPSISIGYMKEDIQNCKFVTLENETIVTTDVANAHRHGNHMHIPKGNATSLIPGSPLICDKKLFALAREISGDDIILDTFTASGVAKTFLNGRWLSVGILVGVCVYFL